MTHSLANITEQSSPSELPLLFFADSRRRRTRYLLFVMIVLSIPIAFISWAIHLNANSKRWGVVLIFASFVIFLSYCLIWFIVLTYHLIKPGPVLIISQQGIFDRRVSQNIIPWNEITMMTRKELLPGHWMVYFEVVDPVQNRRSQRLFCRLPSFLGHIVGHGTFAINFIGLNGSAETAVPHIIAQLAAHSPKAIVKEWTVREG